MIWCDLDRSDGAWHTRQFGLTQVTRHRKLTCEIHSAAASLDAQKSTFNFPVSFFSFYVFYSFLSLLRHFPKFGVAFGFLPHVPEGTLRDHA